MDKLATMQTFALLHQHFPSSSVALFMSWVYFCEFGMILKCFILLPVNSKQDCQKAVFSSSSIFQSSGLKKKKIKRPFISWIFTVAAKLKALATTPAVKLLAQKWG